jgi:hypothetical protein
MTVALDESRDGQLPCEIDDAGGRPDVRFDLVGTTDRGDAIARDGDGLSFRHRVLDRHDTAVGQDEIRWSRRWTLDDPRLSGHRCDTDTKQNEEWRGSACAHKGSIITQIALDIHTRYRDACASA